VTKFAINSAIQQQQLQQQQSQYWFTVVKNKKTLTATSTTTATATETTTTTAKTMKRYERERFVGRGACGSGDNYTLNSSKLGHFDTNNNYMFVLRNVLTYFTSLRMSSNRWFQACRHQGNRDWNEWKRPRSYSQWNKGNIILFVIVNLTYSSSPLQRFTMLRLRRCILGFSEKIPNFENRTFPKLAKMKSLEISI